jgi:hypothetical protein
MKRAAAWLVGLAIAAWYLWTAQSVRPFVSDPARLGYYELAAQGLAAGHLYLPITPPAELLALPNPYDPATNARYRLHDAILFHGRYYMLHLPGPAVALFLPWRLISRHDLPENLALVLFCLGGFAFSVSSLTRLAGRTDPWSVLALGLCTGVPFLLSTVRMYEVAIGAGYFFVSAGIYFLLAKRLTASGIMFAFAVACRPHLALVALAALIALWILREHPIAFAVPVAIAGLLLAWYNFARFGNIFEFGARYQLSGIADNRIIPAASNVLPGLYYLLFAPPDFSAVFPFARAVLRFPFGDPHWTLPQRYFLEPVIGALWQAPFAIAAAASRRLHVVPRAMAVSAVAVLLFLASSGFTTQRYEADFLPLLVWVSLAVMGKFKLRPLPIVFGAVVTVALTISGPYDDLLRQHPDAYLRIARVFSPISKFRPALNPEFSAAFTAEFVPQPEHYREPLVTLGRQAYRYFLYAEHVGGKVRIASRLDDSEIDCLIDPTRPVEFSLRYDRAARTMHVAIDGQERLTQPIPNLVTAPADETIGENRIDPNITEPRFTGRIKRP